MQLVRKVWDFVLDKETIKEGTLTLFFVIIAFVCTKLSGYSMFLSSTLLCILVGMIAGNTVLKEIYAPVSQWFVGKTCLNIGIILLGTKLNIIEVLGFGKGIILFVILIGFTNVLVSTGVGRVLGLAKTQSVILGVGGMSCIVPAGDAVGADKEEIGVAIGAINFSETMLLFILPTIISALKLTSMESAGIFTSAFHIMGYLIAGASAVSGEVLNYTVLIKMARLLTFAPIVIVLGKVFNKKDKTDEKTTNSTVPVFIKGFILLSLIFTGLEWGTPESQLIENTIKTSGIVSSFLINMAMVAIGLKIDIKSLLKKAPKAIICVALTAIFQMILAFGASKILL